MMPTSGKLMIGVASTPPSLPSEVIVNVEPVSSSRRRVAVLRTASPRRSISARQIEDRAPVGVAHAP